MPPADSDYHDKAILAAIQSRLMSRERGFPLVLGDFNGRVWDQRLLGSLLPNTEATLTYGELDDLTVNPQGRTLVQMCRDTNCLIANHLGHLGGGLSFKKRTWISELDLCITSKEVMPLISRLKTENAKNLPSDHAPLEVTLDLSKCTVMLSSTHARSAALGEHTIPHEKGPAHGPPLHAVDEPAFRAQIAAKPPPGLPDDDNQLNDTIMNLNAILNETAKQSRHRPPRNTEQWGPDQERWTRLIESADDRTIWRAIGWNGCLERESAVDGRRPSDAEFKTHFEALFHTENQHVLNIDTQDAPFIPLLDDPFTPREIDDAIKSTKNKSFIGVCAGLLRWLPANWIDAILHILNRVFTSAQYPAAWQQNRLILLFKSGPQNVCGNYRGIAIMDSLGKLYDHMLNARLSRWLYIDKAQAGAQKGRGCVEQIMTLRLLIDHAKCHKRKLFLLFVDFKKAYDKVPRQELLHRLRDRGCGRNMLQALAALYRNTQFMLQSATIEADVGVRQGAPTSCTLFVLYIDQLMRMLHEEHSDEDFLGQLHALLLMDDTVILATSREKCEQKLRTLIAFCTQSGMEMNERKTKLMVINGTEADRQPMKTSQDAYIESTDHYVYLGAHFLDDGQMSSVIKKQAEACSKHVYKFVAFVHKNSNMPFSMKLRVLKAALFSSMLYASETWLTDQLSSVNKHYLAAIKALLGVRSTTANTLCLIELGLPDLSSSIQKRRTKFMKSFEAKSAGDEPLAYALRLCATSEKGRRLQAALVYDGDAEQQSLQRLKAECEERALTSTRFSTYLALNPRLDVHSMYLDSHSVLDTLRIAVSRLRLSSHRLKVETGRWARIPREERLCVCAPVIQDESHVVLECELTEHLRQSLNMNSMEDFFSLDVNELCLLANNILKTFV